MNSPSLLPTPVFAHPGLSLGSHAHACRRACGRLFALKCLAERLHDAVAPRFCTTILGATALIGLLVVWNWRPA